MFDTVSVLPRRLVMGEGEESAVSDSARESKKDPKSYEKIEISDIREYVTGDPLKSIHWKLSSKAEDFLVRDYDTGSSKKTLIFCDLSARFPTEPPERVEEKAPAKDKGAKGSKNEITGTGQRGHTRKNPMRDQHRRSYYLRHRGREYP